MTTRFSDVFKQAPELQPIIVFLGNQEDNIAVGNNIYSFRIPTDFVVDSLRGFVRTAPIGNFVLVDMNVNGSSILSTKLRIDASEDTSVTASEQPVFTSTFITANSKISFDIDQVGSSAPGTGLGITLYGYQPNVRLEAFIAMLSDQTSTLTSQTGVVTLRFPYDFTIVSATAFVNAAPTGSHIAVDIKKNNVSMLTGTLMRIDAGTETSVGSSQPGVFTTNTILSDDKITFDIDSVGSTFSGTGLGVNLIGYRT
jgi:hypothetical protein